jgi:hypothetical protein
VSLFCCKDINEYSEISQKVYNSLRECRQGGMQEEDIIEKLARENGLGQAQ